MCGNRSQPPIAVLLFGSGLCALIYQTVWLREFRLIFGASTAASAAVLAIFMAGLGLGSALLGRRAESARNPLAYYAKLEIWIALSAALTPLLFWLVRGAYIATGGSAALGQTGATIARLVLASLVLCLPTFLMGGTLPAAARAAEDDEDHGRRRLALLYGINTLGAVAGATLSTFFLLERLGNRQTLWVACGLNILVGLLARVWSRRMPELVPTESAKLVAPGTPVMPLKFVLLASAGVGWAFMLMELVWYRMLSPILGGSTFTFGLILAVALLGIGLGGAFYALVRANTRPTVNGFAVTCALEALCIAIPFALGDRLAIFALQLRHLNVFGFEGYMMSWALTTAIVVLPAAMIAGYQFPMLIALLGGGREGVGRQTGLAYAANTAGAIVGSLAGGFGLLPVLSALGAWKLVVVGLVVLAGIAVIISIKEGERSHWPSLLAGTTALVLLFAVGPTAVWRHSGIGAGRLALPKGGANAIRAHENMLRRHTIWEAEGVESSVALYAASGLSFVVNGKVDGNTRGDAGTQVMAGMIGALIHPNPKRSLVVGLGTGTSAGWLGKIPSMERVDVVELEKAILHVAEACSPVNQDVLRNPKVHVQIADARETLLTGRDRYDLIFSEPSNPYRAGIASLFSQEFYRAAVSRLNPGGLFLQWVQAYDVDPRAVHTVFATMGSVFSHVEGWSTQAGDMLLVASREPVTIDVALLRQRVAAEPFRSALVNAWGVDSAEGMLSRFILNEAFARACLKAAAPISTDDRNYLEFGFARQVGRGFVGDWEAEIHALSWGQHWHRPRVANGEVDWAKVDAHRFSRRAQTGMKTVQEPEESEASKHRREWMNRYAEGNLRGAGEYWQKHPSEPLSPFETQMLAQTLATLRAPDAARYIDAARAVRAADGHALDAMAHAAAKEWEPAAVALEKAFAAWHSEPWSENQMVQRTLDLAAMVLLEAQDTTLAKRIYVAVRDPFVVYTLEMSRITLALAAATASGRDSAGHVRGIIDQLEPQPLWTKDFLELRAKTYHVTQHPRLSAALRDLRDLLQSEAPEFREGLGLPAEKRVASDTSIDLAATEGAAAPVPTAPQGQQPAAQVPTMAIAPGLEN